MSDFPATRDFPAARRIRLPDRVTAVGVREPGITLSVHEAGRGPAVVLCHGFPELAYSWRHQIPALADAGFRVIAPDQRGFGGSDAPEPIEAYGMEQLTGDLAGLLEALGVERAIFVGHDWGGFVAWAMPVLHPGRDRGRDRREHALHPVSDHGVPASALHGGRAAVHPVVPAARRGRGRPRPPAPRGVREAHAARRSGQGRGHAPGRPRGPRRQSVPAAPELRAARGAAPHRGRDRRLRQSLRGERLPRAGELVPERGSQSRALPRRVHAADLAALPDDHRGVGRRAAPRRSPRACPRCARTSRRT